MQAFGEQQAHRPQSIEQEDERKHLVSIASRHQSGGGGEGGAGGMSIDKDEGRMAAVPSPSARDSNHNATSPTTADPPRLKIRLGSSTNASRDRSKSPAPLAGKQGTFNAPSPSLAVANNAEIKINGHGGTHHTDTAGYGVENSNVDEAVRASDGESVFKAPLMVASQAGRSTSSEGTPKPTIDTSMQGEQKQQLEGVVGGIDESKEEDEATRLLREAQLATDLQELPNVARQSLVPLYEVVRRAIAKSYTDLQSVVEVLPSQSDHDRKRTIIEYVITTRRQIVKLLVLLRWARDNTQDTERSINLIAFLQRQNFQLERAVQALIGVEGLLAGARVRNYDLVTAVEVLTSGNYSQLPSFFKDSFIAPPKMDNSAVITLLQDLESVIRLRLQLHERLPLQLLQKPYRIHDGRVTFTHPGCFKAAFTLGGDALSDQWYLVDFSFDFHGRDVQQHPSGSMREHILQVCNTQLSECAASEKSFRESEQAAGSASRRGVAFVKASETLQTLSLAYQMELLHYHAIQINATPTIWQGMLAIQMAKCRRTLYIRNQSLNKGGPPPPHAGPDLRYDETLTVTICDEEAGTSSKRPVSERLASLAERCASLSVGSSDSDKTSTDVEDQSKMSVSSRSPHRMLRCTFEREPYFMDAKGKKVSPPVQRKVDLTKVERQISLLEQNGTNAVMSDLEVILGNHFSLKSNMLTQV